MRQWQLEKEGSNNKDRAATRTRGRQHEREGGNTNERAATKKRRRQQKDKTHWLITDTTHGPGTQWVPAQQDGTQRYTVAASATDTQLPAQQDTHPLACHTLPLHCHRLPDKQPARHTLRLIPLPTKSKAHTHTHTNTHTHTHLVWSRLEACPLCEHLHRARHLALLLAI